MQLAVREGGNETIHEAEKLDPAALRMLGDDSPGGDLERGNKVVVPCRL
jgi:hypothetical protein